MKEERLWQNEDGSVLIVALIILVLLTLIGISITRTTETELLISGNMRTYNQNLYAAEAAALEGIQALAGTDPEDLPAWVHQFPSGFTDANVTAGDAAVWGGAQNSADLGATAQYVVVEQGVASFASLDMTRTTVHEYTVYGRFLDNRGRAIVKVGFRRAE
jgi:type IV pilus assembly protein PilX